MLRRVRKEDVQITAEEKPDGLALCLECWKTWMASDDRDLSATRMKLHAPADEREGYDRDVYAEQRAADMRIGEATGAMIEDMKAAYRWAIYKKCGISTLWRFPQLDWMTVAVDAMVELENRLRKNIATATLF